MSEMAALSKLLRLAEREVRYFNDRDKPAVDQAVKVLAQEGFPDAKAQFNGETAEKRRSAGSVFKP